MLDQQTGEVIERRLEHENGEARKFYAGLATPARVGMEATGYAQWFERMLAEQGHQLWVGDAAEIRAAMVRKQKKDSRDACHILDLLLRDKFPRIWIPSTEERDVRQLLRHRYKLVCLRTSLKNQLHAMAMGQGICRPNLSMDIAAYFFAGFEALASKPRYVFNSAVAFFASPDFTASFAASISLSMFGNVCSSPLASHFPSNSSIFFEAPFISLAVTSLSASWASVWYGFRLGVVACCAAGRVDVKAQSIAQTATARNACFRKLRVNMRILPSYLSGISVLAQWLAHRTPPLPPLQRISQSQSRLQRHQ